MTDHDGKLNAVQRIEMKIILALGAEAPHHITGDRRAVELPRHGIVVLDAAEALIEQPWELHIGELLRSEKELVFCGAPVAEPEERLDIKNELGNGMVGASVELCLEVSRSASAEMAPGMTRHKF